jgi:hypothetical protein
MVELRQSSYILLAPVHGLELDARYRMFGSTILEVAIGVIFVFLLLSLIVTGATEVISQMLALRSKTLSDGVRNLLGQGPGSDLLEHPLLRTLGRTSWADRVIGREGRPSYIPKQAFSMALVDQLTQLGGAGSAGPRSRAATLRQVKDGARRLAADSSRDGARSLSTIIDHVEATEAASEQLNAIRVELEKWFDQVMDRAAGWYKRRVNYIVFVVGLVLTVGLNADAVAIANRLASDDELRSVAADAAAEFVAQQDPGNLGGNVEAVRLELGSLDLPLGWSSDVVEYPRLDHPWSLFSEGFWWLKFAGLLVTTFALTLGAPFWFDALSRVVSIRAAGQPPKGAPPSPGAPTGGATSAR